MYLDSIEAALMAKPTSTRGKLPVILNRKCQSYCNLTLYNFESNFGRQINLYSSLSTKFSFSRSNLISKHLESRAVDTS